MAQTSSFSRDGSPLLALLLAALACGDGGSMDATPPLAAAPADMTTPATPEPQSPPPADTAAAAGSTGAGNESSEGLGSNPLPRDEQTPPEGAADGAGEAPASPEPEATPPADAPDPDSLVRGADPTRDSASAPGPLGVVTIDSGLRDGPDYGTQTLFVPEAAEPPFAAVAIVPGFNTPESSIQAWGPFLASHGIVALTIGTNTPTDSADARSRAVLDALQTIVAENTRAGGPLEGQLALDHLGIMGWSLGGGGVLIAASSTPSLKAAITMAAFGPGQQFPNDQVPTLFLAGSADPNAGGQSQGLFASLPETTPKLLFEVEGGPHEIGNDPANANGEVGLYGLSWLEVFLVGDDRYRPLLQQAPTTASDYQQNLSSLP